VPGFIRTRKALKGVLVDPLGLARWQFGIITVYHFLFVPITIGMSFLVAGMQTAWYRTGDERYVRMTKFFGKLFLVNVAIGIVTGIVQEFQFGMNWSSYSRFVGDVFGAPLAMEGLLAFFLESTFIGLWIFGWNRLSTRAHLATIWLAALGTVFSAYFILAANSWMQHPVGYTIDPVTGRARLTSIVALLTNSTALAAFSHVLSASLLTGGLMLVGISAWFIYHRRDTSLFRTSARLGLITTLVAGIAVIVTGDVQMRVIESQQPMKVAAAEALYQTSAPASFSLFTIGSLDGSREVWSVRVPGLLSLLSTGSPNASVEGVDNLQKALEARYGPGDYRPPVAATYWTFRAMVGLGGLAILLSLAGLWLLRKGRLPRSKWVMWIGLGAIGLPAVANSTGWLFTELGRQPWVVQGVLRTADGVSPSVGGGSVLTSMVVFTLLYGVLAVIEFRLFARLARVGPEPAADGDDGGESGMDGLGGGRRAEEPPAMSPSY
jgi:cytochrome d ubiquinol oxidase subunit I